MLSKKCIELLKSAKANQLRQLSVSKSNIKDMNLERNPHPYRLYNDVWPPMKSKGRLRLLVGVSYLVGTYTFYVKNFVYSGKYKFDDLY